MKRIVPMGATLGRRNCTKNSDVEQRGKLLYRGQVP